MFHSRFSSIRGSAVESPKPNLEKYCMPKRVLIVLCLFCTFASAAFAGVTVTSPANGATLQGPVQYVATATTSSCSKGIGSMGIYTSPGVLAYVANGASLNTSLNLGSGTYNTVVEEWDNCGGAMTTPVTVTVSAESGVHVTAPANNGTVGSPVNFVATATTTCSKGVSAMGIYTAPFQLAYVANGASLNYKLTLSPGKYSTVVEEWDKCGGATSTPVTITVSGSGGGGGGGSEFSNLQKSGGWAAAGQGPPNFIDCAPCGPQITWSMTQDVNSPSMSGASSKYDIGGTGPYWDVLFNNHLIGDQSSQSMPDKNPTLVPTYHNFTYDVYFYGSNLGLAQALEFDINQFYDNLGFIWGHECRIAGGNEWDIWDNLSQRWVPTGIACNPISNEWNHLTIQVERTSSNQLLYQSITLNGVTSTVNQYYNPGSTPGWWGVTVNYQMDGNNKQSPYTVYLDELTFSYQ
jgi:hypothetical protein